MSQAEDCSYQTREACTLSFDNASELFDLYIDWDRRLAKEMPWLISRLNEYSSVKVADVACGTGMHAVSLAKEGFHVTAIDPNQALLDKAAESAAECGICFELECASFADLPGKRSSNLDAVLCLGNSLSLVPPGKELQKVMFGLSELLRSEGVLILHTLNYASLSEKKSDLWGPVRVLENGSIVLKGFIPHRDKAWDVILVHLERSSDGAWSRNPCRFEIHPHGVRDVKEAAARAGLTFKRSSGGFASTRAFTPRPRSPTARCT